MIIGRHFSAFKGKICEYLNLKEGSVFYDLTLGDGGHTEETLKMGCKVISFEIDKDAIARAIKFIGLDYTPIIIDPETDKDPITDFQWLIINTNFVNLNKVVDKYQLPKANGILADLGPSQYQTLSEGYGMSFQRDEPLDMRLDKNSAVKALDLLMVLNQGELQKLFELSDEPFARSISKAIVNRRLTHPVTTTKELADLVTLIKRTRGHIHPATQVFMALRMAVNLEREVIRETLPQMIDSLTPGGIMGVISFHSGEEKIVKNFIIDRVESGVLQAINDKPITPDDSELAVSQRTRSAKLRLAKTNEQN